MGFSGSTYGASKKYTDETVIGGGAIKGKNCVIEKIEKVDKTNTVTFKWTLDDGTVKNAQMVVEDGADPNNIKSAVIDINPDSPTYRHLMVTLEDDTVQDWGEMPETEVEISQAEGNALEKKDDGLYVAKGAVEISQAEGNAITSKEDGLYAPQTKISAEEGNIIVEKEDGLYAKADEIKISEKTDNIITQEDDGLYVPKTSVSAKEDNILVEETDGLYVPKAEEQIQADWTQEDTEKADYIKNKPTVYGISTDTDNALIEGTDGELFVPKADEQIQADWEQTDDTQVDFIKNKPTVDQTYDGTSENAQSGKAVAEAIASTVHLTKQIITKAEADEYEADPTKASFNVIYLVKDDTATGRDVYLEFQRLGDETSSSFVCTGDTSTDLSGVVKTEDIATEFGETPSDEKIPSEKLVKETFDAVDDRIDELQLYKSPNATIYGAPTINNGQVSGFTADNYLKFPFLVDFKGRPFEINMAFTTGADVTSQHNIIDGVFGLAFAVQNSKFVLALSGNGTSWDIGVVTGTHAVTPDTNYYVKLTWDGDVYKLSYSLDKEVWVDDITITSSASLYPVEIYIGIGEAGSSNPKPFNGIINMNDSNVYIDGNLFWQGMDDVGIATRLATDLGNIDGAGIEKLKELAETAKKVDIQQRVEDVGKALIVGADGKLYLGDVAIDSLEIVPIHQADYDALSEEEKNDPNKLYDIDDAPAEDFTQYMTKALVGLLADLKTENKETLVSAVNELVSKLKGKVNNLNPNSHTYGLDYTYDGEPHLIFDVDRTKFELARKEDLNAVGGIKHIETITDFNELVPSYWNTTQIFIVDYKGSESLKNAPNNDITHWFVIVSKKSNEVTQIAYETHFNKMYMRFNTAATDESNWSPWVEMITSANMPHLYQHGVVITGTDAWEQDFWFYVPPFCTTDGTAMEHEDYVTESSTSSEKTNFNNMLNKLPDASLGTDSDFDGFTSMSLYSNILVGCHVTFGSDRTVKIWDSEYWDTIKMIRMIDHVKQIF